MLSGWSQGMERMVIFSMDSIVDGLDESDVVRRCAVSDSHI